MEEEIYKKLNSIQDLKDRALLKKVLGSVFTSLQQYGEDRYNQLEHRVFNESEYCEEDYNLFCTIVNKEEIDPTNEFLYPMIQEDLRDKIYDASEIINSIKHKEEINIFKVFLKCSYPTFRDIISQEIVFNGTIETQGRTYEGRFILRENKEYWNLVETLYKGFIDNNVPWTTINNPYISKMAHVVLVSCEEAIEKEEAITKISVDFGEYAKFINYNMVPLWNVRELRLKSIGFPMPCEDKINYEHTIMLKEEYKNHSYIVEYKNYNIDNIIRRKDSLVICCPSEETQLWDVWQIRSRPKTTFEKYSEPLISNSRGTSFTHRFITKNARVIKTKGEIIRIINSFEASSIVEFQYLTLEQEKDNRTCDTYELNYFIQDEIREEEIKKHMVLYFKQKDRNNYLIYDILSFLVSEIQLHYPEYKCEGRLI